MSAQRRTRVGIATFIALACVLGSATPATAARLPLLHMGSTGNMVSRAQHALEIRADGAFGPATRRAVRHFQRRHGLHVDGWIGPDTWHKLLAIRRPRHDAILQLGDVSPGVGRVQRLLQIPADHVFGRQTLHAVLAFQRHHGLLPDGRVGPNTWHALGTSHHGRPSRAALGRRALRIARGYVGVPYVWGGSTPRGFDCSGLVWYAFRRLGVAVPRVTYSQWWAGRHVSRRALRPGDLVFFADRSHVGIWAGHGWFLQAPHTGSVVHFSSFRGWYRRHYAGAVRITA